MGSLKTAGVFVLAVINIPTPGRTGKAATDDPLLWDFTIYIANISIAVIIILMRVE